MSVACGQPAELDQPKSHYFHLLRALCPSRAATPTKSGHAHSERPRPLREAPPTSHRATPPTQRPRPHLTEQPRPPRAAPAHLLKSGPVFQMLVLPTQPRGGSVMFSFSRSSCTAWATTPTASLMWADSFLPLMSCSPMMPGASEGLEPVGNPVWEPRPPGPEGPSTHRPGRSAGRSRRSRAPPPATRTLTPSCSASRRRGTRWQRRPRCGAEGGDGPGLPPSPTRGWRAAPLGS